MPPVGSPPWLAAVLQQVDAKLEEARLGGFVSFTTYDAGGDLPDAAANNGKLLLLENGSFWIARAIAGAWVYPDNTPV